MVSQIERRFKGKQVLALVAFLIAVADHYTRAAVERVTGMSLLEWAVGLGAGKLAANIVGTYLFMDDEEKMEDWMYAESTIYSWWGFEYTTYGLPLNLIPNPIGILQVVGESVSMIHDHYFTGNLKPFEHGSYIRARDYYLQHGTLSGSRIIGD